MKLSEALQAVAASRDRSVGHRAFLACGFEPLHLPTFLRAEYASQFESQALEVSVGLYGDLLGNLERARLSDATLAWVIVEWGDVDPRLGLRSTGPWSGPAQAGLLADAVLRCGRLREAIERLAERMPVVVAGPSVAFPLLGSTSGWQASGLDLELDLELARFCAALARVERVRVLHAGRLAAASPAAARPDRQLELAAGFPYSVQHASTLARGLFEVGFPSPPKKGLITDLDDTLWAGIVGEVGPDAVAWSQAEHAQVHGLYQLQLRQLAEAGVLVAVASKNEKEVVSRALARADLLLQRDALFPMAVSWGPKSEAVSAILRSWNIGADAVVFVDDSRMELEEVRRAHPGMTCLEFAPKNARQALELMVTLRDLFGKPQVLEEDRLRAASIRSSTLFLEQQTGGDLQNFLTDLGGVVTFDASRASDGGRWLELINKTNQFSLNGARLSEGEWLRLLRDESHVVLGIAYRDRLGALGTIGVVVGRVPVRRAEERPLLEVTHWVLSCRAFSRRIEDHILAQLFQVSGVEALNLDYRRTARNQPFQEFLSRLGRAADTDGPIAIGKDELERVARDLPHEVELAVKN